MTTSDDNVTGLTPDQLRQINRLATMAQMVAGLAHELNNSLQVVGGLVELLGDGAGLPPDAQVRVRKIGGQTEKASSAIRQVLAYARESQAAAGRSDLGAVAGKALALRAYHLERARIAVRTDLPSPPVLVQGDERTVLQIVLNLILNAEDALAGQPRRELRLTVDRNAAVGTITVADTGHGIEDGIRVRIFEPFFTTRRGERAVGLGLPVARQLAAHAGGQVQLRDTAPGATTFVVELPLA